MAAIVTSLFSFLRPGQSVVYTVPIYGGTQHFIQDYLVEMGRRGNSRASRARRSARSRDSLPPEISARCCVETPANPTLIMTDIRQAV